MATDDDDGRAVLLIDGANFADFAGFAREFSTLLVHHAWRGNLDAFNDILRGGFGTPETGWVLRWQNSAQRGEGPTLFDEIIRDHGPGGAESADDIVLDLR